MENNLYDMLRHDLNTPIEYQLYHTKQDDFDRFLIEQSNDEISDLTLYIKVNGFQDNLKYSIFKWKIDLVIGGHTISQMDMITNMFLCKVMRKKIVETGDQLIIPICVFDLLKSDKFPLYLLIYHEVYIEISHRQSNDIQISMTIDKYPIDDGIIPKYNVSDTIPKYRTPPYCSIMEYPTCETITHSINNIDLHDSTQLMYVMYDANICQLINISIDGEHDFGEIFHFRVFNQMIAIIPLVDTIKTTSDIRKMFKNSILNFNNVYNRVVMSVDVDPSSISIGSIHMNYYRIGYGMCGLKYHIIP